MPIILWLLGVPIVRVQSKQNAMAVVALGGAFERGVEPAFMHDVRHALDAN